MDATPNTLGVGLLLVVTFFGCILWATHGVPTSHDSEEEDFQKPGTAS